MRKSRCSCLSGGPDYCTITLRLSHCSSVKLTRLKNQHWKTEQWRPGRHKTHRPLLLLLLLLWCCLITVYYLQFNLLCCRLLPMENLSPLTFAAKAVQNVQGFGCDPRMTIINNPPKVKHHLWQGAAAFLSRLTSTFNVFSTDMLSRT